MTKPTPAQIEAAAKALYCQHDKDEATWDNLTYNHKLAWRLDAKAALAAAAEVGDNTMRVVMKTTDLDRQPSAAEVGVTGGPLKVVIGAGGSGWAGYDNSSKTAAAEVGYEPDNCCWATKSQQMKNRRCWKNRLETSRQKNAATWLQRHWNR